MKNDPRQLDAAGLRAHTLSLRGLARAMVKDEHLAEDLVQDAWVTALKRPPKSGWTLRKWLGGITRNHARQEARTLRRRNTREKAAANGEATPPDSTVEQLDLLRHLLDQVGQLDEPYRSTILLHYFDGISPSKVAARQGVPHATVRTRLRRGIELLRQRMDRTVEGNRQAWMAVLLPFATAPSGGPLVAALEAVSKCGQVSIPSGIVALKMKKIIIGSLLLVTLGWIGFSLLWESDSVLPAVDQPPPPSITAPDQTLPGALAATGQKPPGKRRELAEPTGSPKIAAKAGKCFTIQGVVSDTSGQPLAEAKIRCLGLTALSRADGSYLLELDLTKGSKADKRFKLDKKARKKSFAKKSKNKKTSPTKNKSALAKSLPILAAALDHASRSTIIRITPGMLQARADFTLPRAFVVSGRVVTDKGQPVAGAYVWTYLFPAEQALAEKLGATARINGMLVHTLNREGQPVTTNGQGEFRLDYLDPGHANHYVQALAEGFLWTGSTVNRKTHKTGTELVLVLQRGAIVRGHVYAAGKPVFKAKLAIRAGKSELLVYTDKLGAFAFMGVKPGKTALQVQHQYYQPLTKRIDVPAPGQALDLNLNLLVGTIHLGRVQDQQGKPINKARIIVGNNYDSWRCEVKADKGGRFKLPGLPTSWVRVQCIAPGYLHYHQRFDPTSGANLVLTLIRSARIAGQVMDGHTNEPVTNFKVRFIPPVSQADASAGNRKKGKDKGEDDWEKRFWSDVFTSPSGLWDSREASIPEGFVTGLEISAKGYASTIVPRVKASLKARHADLVVNLTKGTTVNGTIVSTTSAKPVAGATVKIVRSYLPLDLNSYKETGHRMVTSGPNGAFAFKHVMAGQCQLAIEHPEFGLLLHPLNILPGTIERRESIIWDDQCVLRGLVRDHAGQPLAGVDLSLRIVKVPGLRGKGWSAKADASGRFTLTHLPAGIYQLVQHASGRGIKAQETMAKLIRITRGRDNEILMAPAAGAKLEGTVVYPDELPDSLNAVIRRQFDAKQGRPSAILRQRVPVKNGVFVFHGLPPGRYRLEIIGYNYATRAGVHGVLQISIEGKKDQRIEIPVRAFQK